MLNSGANQRVTGGLFMPVLFLFLPVLFLFGLIACGDDPGTGPTEVQPGLIGLSPEQHARVARRLAVMATAAAASSGGGGFFNSFLPCTRRGVVRYRQSESGSQVEFTGCDLGDQVVVDGSGELSWLSGSGTGGMYFCGPGSCAERLEWDGVLQIVVDGSVRSSLSSFAVTGIDLPRPGPQEVVAGSFSLGPAQVLIDTTVTPLLDSTLPTHVFSVTGLNPGSISNAGRSVAALTDADLTRIYFELATKVFAAWMFDEVLETQRGDHVHDFGCGTGAVTVLPSNLPEIENEWTACHFARGLFVTGAFTLQWMDFDVTRLALDRLVIRLVGDVEFGGAVPTVDVTEMTWSLESLQPGRGDLYRMSGTLKGAGGDRQFSRTLRLGS